MTLKTLTGLFAAAALLGASPLTLADRDINERGAYAESWPRLGGQDRDVAAVDYQPYLDECGACHFAYQPGLLPSRSWQKMMGGLDDHFGENAELPAAAAEQLTAYLVDHAADRSNHKRSVKLMRSLAAGDTPLRITKIPYFVNEHREVSTRIGAGKTVKNISACQDCHRRAATGSYEEDEIEIPGMGPWED